MRYLIGGIFLLISIWHCYWTDIFLLKERGRQKNLTIYSVRTME